jgi:hypothetical protein
MQKDISLMNKYFGGFVMIYTEFNKIIDLIYNFVSKENRKQSIFVNMHKPIIDVEYITDTPERFKLTSNYIDFIHFYTEKSIRYQSIDIRTDDLSKFFNNDCNKFFEYVILKPLRELYDNMITKILSDQ